MIRSDYAQRVKDLLVRVLQYLPVEVVDKYKKIFASNKSNDRKRDFVSELLILEKLCLMGYKFVAHEYKSTAMEGDVDWLLEKDGRQIAFDVYRPNDPTTTAEFEKNKRRSVSGIWTSSVWMMQCDCHRLAKKIGEKACTKKCDKPLVICVETDFISADAEDVANSAKEVFAYNKYLHGLFILDGTNFVWVENDKFSCLLV